MEVWRICRRPFSVDPLGGKGEMYASGRWHRAGVLVVYAASTLSLAALENLAHTEADNPPSDLVAIKIHIPDDLGITDIPAADLPERWFDLPAPSELQRLGMEWLQRCVTALLRVPPAVIRHEHNFLINPEHPDIAHITVVSVEDFAFDPRLLD